MPLHSEADPLQSVWIIPILIRGRRDIDAEGGWERVFPSEEAGVDGLDCYLNFGPFVADDRGGVELSDDLMRDKRELRAVDEVG